MIPGLVVGGLLGAAVGLSAAVFGQRAGGVIKSFHPGWGALAGFIIGVAIVWPRDVQRARPHPGAGVQDVSSARDLERVLKDRRHVFVHYYATWCVSCRRLAPVIEQLARRYQGRVVFVAVDIDRLKATVEEQGVSAVPTSRFFSNGRQLQEWVGARSEKEYRVALDILLEQR